MGSCQVTNKSYYCIHLQTKMTAAEQTEMEIDMTRSKYIPVAVNTQILFFCVTSLANIDPMYQYSLEWFIGIFLGSIANAEKSGNNHTDRLLHGLCKSSIVLANGEIQFHYILLTYLYTIYLAIHTTFPSFLFLSLKFY